MNSGALFAKASFVLLLLIFGCLVYFIARDYRLARNALPPAQESSSAPRPLVTMSGPTESPAPAREQFAPLRPRTTSAPLLPPPVRPASLQKFAKVSDDVPPGKSVAPEPPVPPGGVPLPSYSAFAGTTPSGNAGGGSAASLTGQVFLRGIPPAEKRIVLDATCGRLHSSPLTTHHYVMGEGGSLANVFIFVKRGSVSIGPPVAQTVLLDQVGCEYQPYVLGVQAGQTLVVRNSDPLLHSVHPEPSNGRGRSVGQPRRGATTPFTFSRAEVFVRFKCDVHPWMFAYVGVVDHPWFGVTGKDGKFTLPGGLTAGRYTLSAVHPKAGELTQEITVTDGGADPVVFTFDVPETLARQ